MGIIKVGGGVNQNYFVLEYQVLFVVLYDRGFYVIYYWDFGEGFGLFLIYYDQNVYYEYIDDIIYNVILNVMNKFVIDYVNVVIIVKIQRGCFNIVILIDDF